MKAEELMLGDYIMFNKNIYIIEEISKKGWVHLIYNDGSKCRVALSNDYILDEITPIPITAEILENNGFGYKEEDDYLTHYYLGDGWYLDNPDLHIGTYNEGVYWLNYCDNAIYGIKYIHQLQHALRLCRIEKEIEL